VRALRPYQWAKNALVFLPVVMAHRLFEAALLGEAALAFAALSLCASGTYVVNDLLDRERDRRHPLKRHRPFASGALTPAFGLALAPVLVGAAFGLALLTLPPSFAGVLLVYLGVTLSYSLRLKRVPALDVVLLGGLYTLRVLGGAAATGVPVSEWLLAFSLFIFLGLALLKRYSELRLMETDLEARRNGRGYTVEDVAMLRGIGPAASFMAVLVLALYITSPEVTALYDHPKRLWLIAPLLFYWTMHLWLTAHRSAMPDDPLLYALRDPVSYLVGALTAGVLVLAAV
jgi:4-hydroxybenzoate polyprenyltransferase